MGATWSMTSARPPYAPTGSPPPTILPRQVRSAEAGDDLVEDQQRAVPPRQVAQSGQVAVAGRHAAHVPRHRLHDHRGQVAAVRGDGPLGRGRVVIGRHHGVGHRPLRHAGRPRDAEGGHARSRRHQQRVRVPVIAALELQDLAPAREAAGQAQRAHGGLGARGDEAHLLDGGQVAGDPLGHLDLGGAGRAVGRAVARGPGHRLHHRRMRVADDHRPPGGEVVDVGRAVGVPHARAVGPGDEPGRAPHGPERADGGVDPARYHALRPREKLFRPRHGGEFTTKAQRTQRDRPTLAGQPAGLIRSFVLFVSLW